MAGYADYSAAVHKESPFRAYSQTAWGECKLTAALLETQREASRQSLASQRRALALPVVLCTVALLVVAVMCSLRLMAPNTVAAAHTAAGAAGSLQQTLAPQRAAASPDAGRPCDGDGACSGVRQHITIWRTPSHADAAGPGLALPQAAASVGAAAAAPAASGGKRRLQQSRKLVRIGGAAAAAA